MIDVVTRSIAASLQDSIMSTSSLSGRDMVTVTDPHAQCMEGHDTVTCVDVCVMADLLVSTTSQS